MAETVVTRAVGCQDYLGLVPIGSVKVEQIGGTGPGSGHVGIVGTDQEIVAMQ